MWPTKFKREMAQQMISGKLSVRAVQKTCRVSNNTAYKWKNKFGENGTKLPPVAEPKAQVFSEIKVVHDQLENSQPTEQITLKHGDCELCLPSGYPVTQLTQLICALDAKT